MTANAGRLPLALAAVLGLTGCGTVADYFQGGTDNIEPPAELVGFTPAIDLQVVWKRRIGSGADDAYLKLNPATDGESIYVADRNGSVRAFDATTGAPGWSQDTDAPVSGGPGVGATVVAVGTSDGQVIALDRRSGQIRWRARVTSEVLSAPAEGSGVVVARTIDGKLFGLDAVTGKRLWVYDRTVPVLTLRGTSAPVIHDDVVVAGFDSGRMVGVALADGQQLWESAVAAPSGRSELERMVDIDADPVVVDDVIYAATFQGRVSALALYSGNVLWQRDMSSHAGLAVDGGEVFVTDDNSHVWALERSSSASLWRQSELQARAVSAPAVFREFVVVGDLEGYVHWLRREDGSFAARVRVDGGAIVAVPLALAGAVYVYSSGGTLTALAVR